jgi:DNA/RNA endonuclease G (NUC1)
METTSNLESGTSTVQYRFDGGHVVRQGWWIGDDNETLFYPGNCTPFIKQLGEARSLAFEYHPADKIESTVTFDVVGFPNVFNVAAPPVSAKHHAVAKPCVLWELATPACHEKD